MIVADVRTVVRVAVVRLAIIRMRRVIDRRGLVVAWSGVVTRLIIRIVVVLMGGDRSDRPDHRTHDGEPGGRIASIVAAMTPAGTEIGHIAGRRAGHDLFAGRASRTREGR